MIHCDWIQSFIHFTSLSLSLSFPYFLAFSLSFSDFLSLSLWVVFWFKPWYSLKLRFFFLLRFSSWYQSKLLLLQLKPQQWQLQAQKMASSSSTSSMSTGSAANLVNQPLLLLSNMSNMMTVNSGDSKNFVQGVPIPLWKNFRCFGKYRPKFKIWP